RDNKSGHIIDNVNENDSGKGKGKSTGEGVAIKNKFDSLQAEEIENPTLMITDGKEKENNKDQQQKKQSLVPNKKQEKQQEKEKVQNARIPSPNPNPNGIRLVGKEGNPNPFGGGIQKREDQIRVKKEVVEKGNPSPIGVVKPIKNGTQILEKDKAPNHIDSGIDEADMRESTLEWVHRRFGAKKEEIRQMNVTLNHSCQ
ncbi:hypothetical protein A4A49_58701, partial [Nicotiana attenuata]